jgi:hypothetical protein
MVVEFDYTDSELLTLSIATETSGLTVLEKVEWSYRYTHRAANFQGKLVNAYTLDNLPWVGEDLPIPQAAKDAWKANINTLANRIVTCQTYIDGVTD